MNRRIVFLFVLCMVLAAGVFGQSDTALLNTKRYLSYFSIKKKENIIESNYMWAAPPEVIVQYGNLNWSGEEDMTAATDIPIEFALLSYYSEAVVKIRPVEAERVLPAGDARLSTLKLGAALYQDIVVLRFLGDTAAIGRYEGMLKFICDENGVTRTDVENYFRAGIRELVSEIVNEEFNKISFLIRQNPSSHGGVLTRNPQNGRYTLSYEDNVKNATKELSGQTLEALLSAMRNSGDFSQSAINIVRDQAPLMPAVVYTDWHSKGVARGADAMKILVDTLTNFYLNPNRTNYEAVRGIFARYKLLDTMNDPLAGTANMSYRNTMLALSDSLYNRVTSEVAPRIVETAKIPDNPLYNVFATRYGAER